MDSFDERIVLMAGTLVAALVGALFKRNLKELDNTMGSLNKTVKELRDEIHGKDNNDGIKSRMLVIEGKIEDQEALSERLAEDIRELRRALSEHSRSSSEQLTDVKIGLSECVGMLKTLIKKE